jgi:hypothetical protein
MLALCPQTAESVIIGFGHWPLRPAETSPAGILTWRHHGDYDVYCYGATKMFYINNKK